MKIRLLTSLAGPDGAWAMGDLYECDEATAARMLAAGMAERISAIPVIETAMTDGGPEKAVTRKGRPKS